MSLQLRQLVFLFRLWADVVDIVLVEVESADADILELAFVIIVQCFLLLAKAFELFTD